MPNESLSLAGDRVPAPLLRRGLAFAIDLLLAAGIYPRNARNGRVRIVDRHGTIETLTCAHANALAKGIEKRDPFVCRNLRDVWLAVGRRPRVA